MADSQHDGYLYNGETVPNREWWKDGIPEVRRGLVKRFLDVLGLERKGYEDRPDFGRASYWADQSNYLTYGYGLRRDMSWDQRRELGDLSGSSLVMAVCNDTGISLAEAEPTIAKPDSKGELQPDRAHPLAALILNPNPYHIWEDYTLAGAFSWWADGNWYFQKVRDNAGAVVELWYLPHFMVEPRWPNDGKSPAVPMDGNPDPFLSHYQYTIPGKDPVFIPATDVVHLKRGVNMANPRKGVGAFEPLITEIYGDKKAGYFSATILQNMGIVVPIISPKDKDVTINEEQAKSIKEKYVQQTTGPNSGMPVINAVPIDVTKFAFSPQEMDLKELRMIPESRVAAVTRYPASYLQFLVGLQNGTSYASYREAREQAYESVIEPIQKGIARRLTQQLLPEFETTKGARFYFDTTNVSVKQEDKDNLMTRAVKGYMGDVLKRSDARKLLGLETTPEDDAYRSENAPQFQPGQQEPPKAFGSYAELQQYLDSLEVQMKDFVNAGS